MRLRWLAALLAAVALLSLAAACGGDDDDDDDTSATATSDATSSGAPGLSDLAHSVVQIEAIDNGDTIWTGSGTFITKEGLILTNGHVVDDRFGEYDQLGIAITVETDEPPDLRYLAEIVAVDYGLDLAVIQVTSDLDGGAVLEDFPTVPLGDSDAIDIGDELQILGYPGIGGETITLTRGVVAGFTAERSVGGRAWIKTDATIAGGNSGGLGINRAGELIGVPTIVGSGSEASTTDCRLLEDTNSDGAIDDLDSCVPVGGFINGLRPVNLATALIEAAIAGEEYISEIDPDVEPTEVDVTDIFISNMVFSPGVTDDNLPTEIVETLPSGSDRLCAFWDYEGMQDGISWDAVWYIDGERDEDRSFIDDTWVGGEAGNWWVCVLGLQGATLDEGLYEIILNVQGDPIGSNAIFVGGEHPTVQLDISNVSDFDICYAYVSPTGAQNWGFDDLSDAIPSGGVGSVLVPAGTYDLLLEDCAFDPILEDYELNITEDSTYTVTNEGTGE